MKAGEVKQERCYPVKNTVYCCFDCGLQLLNNNNTGHGKHKDCEKAKIQVKKYYETI